MSTQRRVFLYLACMLELCAAALCLFLVALSAQAQSQTRFVAPGAECGDASPCYATIQAAVDAAADGDTIKVARGIYTSSALQVLYLNKAVSITGGYVPNDWTNSHPLTQTTVIDAENGLRRRGVYIDGTQVSSVTLDGLRVQQGYVPDSNGAGIYILSGTVTLRNLQVISNTVNLYEGRGAGVYAEDGSVLVQESTFANNSAGYGGGLYFSGQDITVAKNYFRLNVGTYFGGAVAVSGARTAEVFENTFEANRAPNGVGGGGGIGGSANSLILRSNHFLDNRALYGGGAKVDGATVELVSNYFEGNSCDGGGGGANVAGFTVTVSSNTFSDNVASLSGWYGGGGLYLAGYSTDPLQPEYGSITVTDNILEGNTARHGGGIYFAQGVAVFESNSFWHNSAQATGGGLFVIQPDGFSYYSVITTTRNVFRENSLDLRDWSLGGGSIGIDGAVVHAENDLVVETISSTEAIYLSDGSLTAMHLTLADNGSYALTASGGSARLTNTIVASNTVGGFSGNGVVADHTLFFNSGVPCGGGAVCIDSLFGNPLFLNPGTGNYHIDFDSLAVDAGAISGLNTDIDGQPRPQGVGYDLGADETGLLVRKMAQPKTVVAGQVLTYTVQVTNTTHSPLTVTITDTLPQHAWPTGPVVWTPDPILPLQDWSAVLVVHVDEEYEGRMTNTVQAVADEGPIGVSVVTVDVIVPGYFIYLPVLLRGG